MFLNFMICELYLNKAVIKKKWTRETLKYIIYDSIVI